MIRKGLIEARVSTSTQIARPTLAPETALFQRDGPNASDREGLHEAHASIRVRLNKI